jgi:vancomycin resistance protein YoaR
VNGVKRFYSQPVRAARVYLAVKENVAVPSSPVTPSSTPVSVAPAGSSSGSRRRTSRWPLYTAIAVIIAGVVSTGLASGAYSKWTGGNLIAPGVAIAGVPVGGLTKSEAQAELEKRFSRLFVTLQTEKRPFNVSLKELGGDPAIAATVQKAYQVGRDGSTISNFLRVYGSKTAGQRFMLPIQWRKPALVAKLTTINHMIRVKPTDALLKVSDNGVQIVPEKVGTSLNIGETALQIQKKYFVGTKVLEAATREVAPKVAAADLAGEDVELGHYTTTFNRGIRGRTTNIRVACAAIDGHVLMPGDAFSFNGMTGERTFSKGYRMAHIFERKPGETESEVVDGLAGGVCQVSSTLYNAVRKANNAVGSKRLKIVERSSHSLPVTYVPVGFDATVAWPYRDFRFRNTFDHPVYVRTTISGSRLRISLWGRVPSNRALELAQLMSSDDD